MWNNDLELKFIEHFHDEPILWDPKHRNYKDKSLNHDAWSRIGVLMDMPVPEVKKKKESLFASYRKYRKMVKNSVRSGAGENDIYKPIWFAYDALDSFLGDGLTPRETINTISTIQPSTSIIPDEEEINNENNEIQENRETPETRSKFKKIPKRLSESDASKNLQKAIGLFEETIRKRQAPPDDSEIYAMGLAKKLRAFSEEERLEIMYEIDGMIIRRRRAKHLNTDYTRANVASPIDRPPSGFSSTSGYSEPVMTRYVVDRHNNYRMAFLEPPEICIPDNADVSTCSNVQIISNDLLQESQVSDVIYKAFNHA